jgi:3-hydroxybutyryl-CoA dehydrogenase
MTNPIRTVAIVGTGLMGKGIAEVCALFGLKTVAIKATPGGVEGVRRRVLASLDRAVEEGKLTLEQRERAESLLGFGNDLGRVSEADLIIETAAENVSGKLELLRRISSLSRSHAVITSNTSSLRLSTLADAIERPARFFGLHFFSPANVMKLVEIGVLPKSDERALQALRAFCREIGKVPVELGDHPGYLVNRLLVPYVLHAIETLEHGVAGPEAIDTAMKLGCGHPLGPLALADLIGLDVVFAMSRSLSQELTDTRYRCPPLLRRLVMAGTLGKKTGAGFYLYQGDTPRQNPAVLDFARPSSPNAASHAPAA